VTANTTTWTNTPAAENNGGMPTTKFIWQLLRYRPWLYLFIVVLRAFVIAGAFQATGLIIRGFFDTLTGERSIAMLGNELGPLGLSVLLVAVALVQAGLTFAVISAELLYRFTIGTLMRKNLFARILDRTGAQTLPGTTGDAISRFGSDVEGIVNFIMRFPHLIGMGLLAVSAVFVMLSINARITVLSFFPLVIIVTIANIAMRRVQVYRDTLREASGDVSSFIGEMFGAVQAIKVASAEKRTLGQFRKLNDVRQKAALQDNLFGAILNSVFENIVSVSTGLILILAGYSIQSGAGDIDALTVGDLALFIFYLGIVTGFTSQMGELSAEYRRAEINKKRVQQLLQGDSPAHIVAHSPVYLRSELPSLIYKKKTAQDRLETLEIRNLSYNHSQTKRGIEHISFSLTRGTLTVITGRIGTGKTTLIRTLLGLLPKDDGVVLWNGEVVSDPGSFFITPYCAYTPQVPVLFSESVRDNILMGLPEEEVDLPGSIRLAVMELDVETLEDGLDTIIGVRGVRLSGGQAQRTAAARMFVRNPELLVFDDLSSALDVETERQLWNRLLRKEATCLAVSHRRSVLRLADNIVLLKDSKVEAIGRLETLLETSKEMQHLWQSDLVHTVDELV
jgi:ATP-binding cassette subfamily B protein